MTNKTMQHYQIYGIGNALVDFEIETSVSELSALNIDKGVMTLIEEARQEELALAFKGKHHSRACGGSAANTIIGAQSLGSQCFYSCKVANDESGLFYRDDLLSHGVHSNLADNYQQIDEDALSRAEYLYIEGYLSSAPMALEAAVKARQFAQARQIKTAFSLSDPNMVKFCRPGLEAIIGGGVDLLFCNLDEALMFSECETLEAAASQLAQRAKTLVITLGAKGALVVHQGQSITVAGHEVKAIDTNGAGDCFAGSFLHGICHGMSLAQAGKLASFAAAQLVTQYGPRLTPEKLVQVKAFAAQLNAQGE